MIAILSYLPLKDMKWWHVWCESIFFLYSHPPPHYCEQLLCFKMYLILSTLLVVSCFARSFKVLIFYFLLQYLKKKYCDHFWCCKLLHPVVSFCLFEFFFFYCPYKELVILNYIILNVRKIDGCILGTVDS